MRRQLAVAVAAIGVLALALASPAQARHRTHSPPFVGSAPGSITCSASVKVIFHPAMKNGVVPNKATVVGKFTNCLPSAAPMVTVTKGVVPKSQPTQWQAFTESPINCAGNPAGGADFAVSWKGRLTGSYLGAVFAGRAQFDATTVGPVVGTGEVAATNPSTGDVGFALTANDLAQASFTGPMPNTGPASGAFYSQYSAGQLAAQCSGKGVAKLLFTGSVTFG